MYNLRWLSRVAHDGLTDLLPAIRRAFNEDPTDDRLELVYGRKPRRNIVVIAVAGILAGAIVDSLLQDVPFSDKINWPAIVVGGTYALLIRHYLFGERKAAVEDFPWLAASIAPAAVLLMILSAVMQVASLGNAANTAWTAVIGAVLVAGTDALGVAAALTIAVAALCFSRDWPRALGDLAIRLLVFRIMVWVTALIMLDIGIIGPIVGRIFASIFGFSLPDWLPELVDELGYVALLCVVYLAVIGATWTVCRRSFAALLASGQVDILATVAQMAKDPAKVRKQEEKKARKAKKRERAK